MVCDVQRMWQSALIPCIGVNDGAETGPRAAKTYGQAT